MIDYHCHLDLYPDPGAVLDQARSNGVGILSVTNAPSAWRGTSQIAGDDDGVRTALGLHPQLARQRKHELALFDQLLPLTAFVGEVGLDGTKPFKDIWEDQVKVLDHILGACQSAGGKVISAHTRGAVVPFLKLISEHPGAGLIILHWFSGTRVQLERAVALDSWFSVGPAMLASAKGRDLVAAMPRDRVLLESDGPFAQMNGAALQPRNVALAERMLSGAWQARPADVSFQLRANEQSVKRWARSL